MTLTATHPFSIEVPEGVLLGDLRIPATPRGTVIFAHGSGSSRHSPRNTYVAESLNASGFSTLLMDLLTPAEEQADRFSAHLRFDIELLAERLGVAAAWVKQDERIGSLPLGFFGASTGAAAALVAAARQPEGVFAVVSRGGRPDLAGESLTDVKAPTLLIVGGLDFQVIELNRLAKAHLYCETQLVIVPSASHLFEEPGALECVAQLARDWFREHVPAVVEAPDA